MNNESKYPVNGKDWDKESCLYRVFCDALDFSESEWIYCKSVSEAKECQGAYSSVSVEQRYSDLQIELLQKDEGWIVGDWKESPVSSGLRLLIFDSFAGEAVVSCSNRLIWGRILAYKLVTNDHYINGERVVLREGDYVCKNMAHNGKDEIKVFEERVRTYSEGLNHIAVGKAFYCKRLLTLAQVMNAESAKRCDILQEGKPFTDKNAWKDVTEDRENAAPEDEGALKSARKYIEENYMFVGEPAENDTPEPYAQSARWDYKNGELPPVGMVCELAATDHNHEGLSVGDEVAIINHVVNDGTWLAVFTYGVQGSNFGVNMGVAQCFRPIQSEREKVIEKSYSIYENDSTNEEVAGWVSEHVKIALGLAYDAGSLKMPEGE